ncbi:NUDIX hydrolase [Paracoccus sp. 1_MG-2023]|uniref:NUDIX domain-containing protein n=1 Tax=unclassified Paracoccus (in: a-proteobacteria) TaxID=2688777 RepID=UPI001C086B08|nr:MULTISPECIES: NUDIX hydrolase [unclassified Paracoccus (in: a-proteobacteria)]MBU2957046.1 NUDIX hydrolase [Paracoccus sp. C2R09]MDO6668244.1 NUDIX hydrolase [Paracoccus sp. 1_MG-2023]
MIPRFGQPPSPRHAYRRRAGAYAILWRDGRILLTFQRRPEPEFQLPGGGIDPGESPIRALHREVYEETGWRIGQAQRIGAYRRFCNMPELGHHAEKRCEIWVARPTLLLGPPTEPGHSAHWVTPSEALALIEDAGSLAALSSWLGGR